MMATQTLFLDMKKLVERIETMMCQGENLIRQGPSMTKAYVCQVCGKEDKKSNIKNHIEAHHLEGFSILCKICGKTFMIRQCLRNHALKHEKKHGSHYMVTLNTDKLESAASLSKGSANKVKLDNGQNTCHTLFK